MHDLNNKATNYQLLLVAFWIVFTVLAFSYFINDKLISFDVNNKLEGIEHQQLGQFFKEFTGASTKKTTPTIMHFFNESCQCRKFSEKHIGDINNLANSNNINVIDVLINEHQVIPATPSVAIIGNEGEVIYFGPYGEGLACSKSSGYAKTVLNNFLKGYSANIVVTEAKGCYCST